MEGNEIIIPGLPTPTENDSIKIVIRQKCQKLLIRKYKVQKFNVIQTLINLNDSISTIFTTKIRSIQNVDFYYDS